MHSRGLSGSAPGGGLVGTNPIRGVLSSLSNIDGAETSYIQSSLVTLQICDGSAIPPGADPTILLAAVIIAMAVVVVVVVVVVLG